MALFAALGGGLAADQPPTALPSSTRAPASTLDAGAAPAGTVWPRRLELPGIPNPIQVNERVISGGLPHGEEAFAALARLGVKTILSVDGARPDVELARKYGLRYVHLPHGYDGIPQQRLLDLAKAIRELPGPIYIHCHHGKHRSPAAAAAGCVAAGLIPKQVAVAVLETAGTSPHYRGLFQAVHQAEPLPVEQVARHQAKFPEIAAVPPLAAAMVDIDEIFERLKLLAAHGWNRVPDQPDLDSAHEALLLKEQYRELGRQEAVRQKPAEFREMLAEAEATVGRWEAALRAWQAAGSPPPIPEEVGRLYQRAGDQCRLCHERFRDTPLSEKGAGSAIKP